MNFSDKKNWSYLDTDILLPSDNVFLKAVPSYRFKVFRYTTRFKKFNVGITKMVRRKYARRKHQTSWISHSYVAKHWTVHYMKEKQFTRFIQTLGLFHVTAGSPSVSVFNSQVRGITNLNGINIASCSKPVMNKYISFLQQKSYLSSFTTNGAAVIVQTNSTDRLNASLEINPNNILLDNLQYPRDLESDTKNMLITSTISSLNKALFSAMSQKHVSIRRIITLLILLHASSN